MRLLRAHSPKPTRILNCSVSVGLNPLQRPAAVTTVECAPSPLNLPSRVSAVCFTLCMLPRPTSLRVTVLTLLNKMTVLLLTLRTLRKIPVTPPVALLSPSLTTRPKLIVHSRQLSTSVTRPAVLAPLAFDVLQKRMAPTFILPDNVPRSFRTLPVTVRGRGNETPPSTIPLKKLHPRLAILRGMKACASVTRVTTQSVSLGRLDALKLPVTTAVVPPKVTLLRLERVWTKLTTLDSPTRVFSYDHTARDRPR